MINAYANWLAATYPEVAETGCYGECAEVTAAMVEAFPELRRAAGFVQTAAWGRRQHWWCVDRAGNIVDLTAGQFPGGVFCYDELDLNDPEDMARMPSGRCMDCGGDVYCGKTFCSAACEASTQAYLGI